MVEKLPAAAVVVGAVGKWATGVTLPVVHLPISPPAWLAGVHLFAGAGENGTIRR
jgi:hypothetical protein